MLKHLFVLVLAVCYVCSNGVETETKYLCENQNEALSCPRGQVIQIHQADYGRSITNVCQDSAMSNLNCHSNKSQELVQNLCNNKQSCKVVSSYTLYGDPCYGTSKYLKVSYECKAAVCRPSQFKCNDGGCLDQTDVCNGIKDCSGGEDEKNCKIDTKYLCENQNEALSCPQGQVIQIHQADYGRSTTNVCQNSAMSNLNCHSNKSQEFVQNLCNDKQSCKVVSSYTLYGDPCYGTSKYLKVSYECKAAVCRPSQFKCNNGGCLDQTDVCNGIKDCSGGEDEKDCKIDTKYLCENQNEALSCPQGQVIQIHQADYGRSTTNVCQNSAMSNLNCHSNKSQEFVQNLCNDKQSCKVVSSNTLYGDPCYGTFKYLKVSYECKVAVCRPSQFKCNNGGCLDKTDICNGIKDCSGGEDERNCKIDTKYLCENQNEALSCPPGQVIQIHQANYGRATTNVCQDSAMSNLNCHSNKSQEFVQNLCNNKQSCKVVSSYTLYGDPCYGTSKYLKVSYECKGAVCRRPQFKCRSGPCLEETDVCNGIKDCPGGEDEDNCRYKTVKVCEGSSRKIECVDGETIDMISGDYGRTNSAICSQSNNTNTNCRSKTAYNILYNKCDGEQTCMLTATDSVFGNPCGGTTKYIDFRYRCSASCEAD